MLDLKCRLCSSDSALISLSGGKSRKNRDYIRKLVEVTTGIKYEKDDFHKYICYPCVAQVYNFYLFKTRSLENEKILEAHIAKDEKKSSNKMQILNLSNIILPDINGLQHSLAPWLISKSKYCELSNNENLQNTEAGKLEQNTTTDKVRETVQNQSPIISVTDVSIQCYLPQSIVHKNTQTASAHRNKYTQCTVSNAAVHTQTSEVATVDKSTQNTPSSDSFDKYTQCTISNAEIDTQTNGILTKTSKIQCLLLTERRGSRTSSTHTKGVDKATQYYDVCESCGETDCKCYLLNMVSIKQEPQLSTSIHLSPLNSSIEDHSKNISPIPYASTPISIPNSFSGENQIACKMCEKILTSKESYLAHKKFHMMCTFCKKKFPSMKRARWHEDNDCQIGKMIRETPVVQLDRLENMKEVEKIYSKCLEDLNDFERRRKHRSTVRMRSRSTSSVDSFYSCCSFCRNSLTVLQGVKLGRDKCVQTSFFGDGIVPELVNGDVMLMSKFQNVEGVTSRVKKRKLSNSLVG